MFDALAWMRWRFETRSLLFFRRSDGFAVSRWRPDTKQQDARRSRMREDVASPQEGKAGAARGDEKPTGERGTKQ